MSINYLNLPNLLILVISDLMGPREHSQHLLAITLSHNTHIAYQSHLLIKIIPKEYLQTNLFFEIDYTSIGGMIILIY